MTLHCDLPVEVLLNELRPEFRPVSSSGIAPSIIEGMSVGQRLITPQLGRSGMDLDVACLRLWSLSPDGRTLVLQAKEGLDVPFDGLGDNVPVFDTELGEVVQQGKPFVVDCRHESAPPEVRDWARVHQVESFIAVPIPAESPTLLASVVGVLAVFSRTPVEDRHVETLVSLAGTVRRGFGVAPETPEAVGSEEILKSLIHCLPSAVITLDLQGKVTRWNASAEQLFGWTEAEVCGKTPPFLLDARRHEFPDNLAQTLPTGRVVRSRTVCRRADDALCHVQRSTSLLFDRRGEVVGRVEVFADESHRVRTARCLQIQSQVTRIVNGSRDFAEMAPLVLAAVGEWIGCEAAEFWSPDEQSSVLTRKSVWAKSSELRRRMEASEFRVETSSANWPSEALRNQEIISCEDVQSPSVAPLAVVPGALRVPVEGIAVPVRTEEAAFGVMTCLGGAVHQPDELTKQTGLSIADAVAQFLTRLKAEASLAQTEANLRQSQMMDAIGLLAGGVAHDFNNLLTIILAYGEMGLDEVEESNTLHELFVEIHGAGERAAAMTKQLLAVSRRQPTRVTSCDLNRLVDDMERMLQRLVGSEIQLTRECESSLAKVQADVNQLEQVLLNLVVNARDAMPNGGTITVRTENITLRSADVVHDDANAGAYVKVSVQDTGCGMDAATKARIFEPFFTTKEVGRGTGMGLSTVFGIIKQSGGFLRVDSEVNVGTTFSVFLPQSREVLAVRNVDDEPDLAPVGTEQILLVENDAAVRNLIRRLLEVRGYHVVEAVHGGEALEILRQPKCSIDLVLTDIQMPVVNGIALVRKIRELPRPVQIVMMSGNTDPPHDLKFDQSWQFLAKPFTSHQLATSIRKALDMPVQIDNRSMEESDVL